MTDRPEIVKPDGVDLGDSVAAIEAFVARLEAAQQAEDVVGFMALFAERSGPTRAGSHYVVSV
jgi:hypothetical protein